MIFDSKTPQFWSLFFLILVIIQGGRALLIRTQQQFLLDEHNGARKAFGASNMRAMTWSSSLAIEAEKIARTCSNGPVDRSALSVAVDNRYSWIGENRHVLSLHSINQNSLQQAFSCWNSGLGSCMMTNKAQILYPSSYLLGCGAHYFSSNDRCHDIGVGTLVVCFYAPGSISTNTDSSQTNSQTPCSNCPMEAPHCVTDLCSSQTTLTPVPAVPVVDTSNPIVLSVSSVQNNRGSYGGGTLLTLLGRGFSADQFNRDNPNLGNRVILTNGVYNVTCTVINYYTSTEKITCRTGPSPERIDRSYTLMVTVDGKAVTSVSRTFHYRIGRTPRIDRLSTYAIVPGVDNGSITLTGRIYTYKIADTQEGLSDVPSSYSSIVIERLLVGGELCNPWTEDQNTSYGGRITNIYGYGDISCKPETNRIDSMNVSIVASLYGNSELRYPHLLSIDNKLRQYMFQTHSDITRVEPNRGIPDGGTLITIYGRHLSDPQGDVKAYISGVSCRVIKYTNVSIQCITGPAPPNSTVYPGGRGMLREVFLSHLPNLNNFKSSPPNGTSVQESMYRDNLVSIPEFGERSYFHQRYSGFFVPPIDSLYTLNVISDDISRLYLSPNMSKEHKELVAYLTSYAGSGQWELRSSQKSKPIYLKAGHSYYMEAIHSQFGGLWRFGIGVKVHNLTLTKDRAVADHEKQRIQITSVVTKETQRIDVFALPKVQTMTLELDDDDLNITYHLSFNGFITPPLSQNDNDTIISTALNSLQSVQNIGNIIVKSNMTSLLENDTLELTFIFVTLHDNLPNIFAVNVTSNFSINILQNETSSFQLGFGTRQTPVLPSYFPANNLSVEITNLFSTSCEVLNPGEVVFQATYDINIERTNHGFINSNREPYCGRYSARNPILLWKRNQSRDERTNTVINDGIVVSLFAPKYLCFAFYGSLPQFQFTITQGTSNNMTQFSYSLPLSNYVNRWNYTCINAFTIIHTKYNNNLRLYKIYEVNFVASSTTFWIDEFTIGTSKTRSVTQVLKAVRPGGVFVHSVSVTNTNITNPVLSCTDSDNPSSCNLLYAYYTVEFTVHNCGHNMPLMTASSNRVSRLISGSPPVTGTFDFTFENITIYNISATSTGPQVKALLERILKGKFTVTYGAPCTGYSWDITWDTRGGDLPLSSVNGSKLLGHMTNIRTVGLLDGGVWIRPLRGDMVRLPELKPQVQVSINGIPASCRSKLCGFEFTKDGLPIINSISPNTSNHSGIPINILGSNFGDNITKVTVTIGSTTCPVTSVNNTVITCTSVPLVAGLYTLSVHINGTGYAVPVSPQVVKFNVPLVINTIEPREGSISGGNIVMIKGTGFPITTSRPYSSNFYIHLDDHLCLIISSNYTTVTCRPQPHYPANVNVTVNVNGLQSVIDNGYKYNAELVVLINDISPLSGPPFGGTLLMIEGGNFSNDSIVTIGNVPCNISSIDTKVIYCTTKSNTPGSYPVIINSPSLGTAITHTDLNLLTSNMLTVLTASNLMLNNTITNTSLPFLNIPKFTYSLIVTGITPCSGSLGGNRTISISGEGFSSMTTISIGDRPCTAVTRITESLINCTTPSITGQHHTIENNGSHQELGLYFAWSPDNLQILQGDTVTWKWIGSRLATPQKIEVHQSSSRTSFDQIPGGFQSHSSIDGNFTYTFTRPGTYYYSTFISICNHCIMAGSISVLPLSNTPSRVIVKEGPFEALYNISQDFDMEESESGSGINGDKCLSCHNLTDSLSFGESPIFLYSLCDTPVVNRIDFQQSTLFSTISLYGNGFGYSTNNTNVMFGSHICTLVSSYTNEQMSCVLDNSSQPIPYVSLPLSLHITNKGYGLALNESISQRVLVIKPVITGLSPLYGSILGGNILTISGASFISSPDLKVYLGNKECIVSNVSYHQIKCTIPPSIMSNVTVNINVSYGFNKDVICATEGGCVYQYLLDYTPSIQDIHPITLSGNQQTLITITGTLLQSDALVKIGPYNCTNVTLINTNITCYIQPIQASQYNLSVLVPSYGYAQDNFTLISLLKVYSVFPHIGSVRGGTILTLKGIGFSNYHNNNSITIFNRPCLIKESNYTTVLCSTPDLQREGNYSINVNVTEHPTRSRRDTANTFVFTYDQSYTPQVNSVEPMSGQQGDSVNIMGTGFSGKATVSIGNSICNVSSQTNDTMITCVLGSNYVGVYPIDVLISGKGRAMSSVNFTYVLRVTSISPTMNSFAGQNILTVLGIGFDPVATFIKVCERICTPSFKPPSLTSITCIVPSFSDIALNNVSMSMKSCQVNVTSLSFTISLPQPYTLHRNMTPFVTFINRTRGGTGGGSLLKLIGTGFTNDVNVTIAGKVCTIRYFNETVIICETGASGRTVRAPVMVYVKDKGYAVSTAEQFYYVDLWSSNYTWGGKALPVERDFVIVPSGQTLVLDICTPVLSILLIQGGELIFDDERDGVELHSENILITDGGSLQIGTEEAPYQHKAQIVMYGNRVSTELPLFGAKTLAVRNGTLDLHGKPIINTWTCLSSTVRAGEEILNVKHNVSDWEIGGTIVVASTSFSRRQNEELIIKSISNDGKNITVTTPLQYTHISMIQTIQGKDIETCAEVGYLTRNVVVRGNRNYEWDRVFENCQRDFNPGQFAIQSCFNGRFGAEIVGDQFGSQIMLHRGPKDKVVGRISYIEVTHAGQAFRLGRYPIHFHLNGDVNGSYVRGCGIHHTFNRAVTIHGVDNLLVEHNVAYDILGHAYFLEDGIEEGNIIQYNLGIFVRASSSLLNVDITPATFWSVNPNNIFRHNAAAGGTHFGFWYRLPANPTGPSYTPHVKPRNRPMGQFYNNTAHSFGWYGLWIFPSYHPVRSSTCTEVTPAVFDTFLAWRNVRGIEFVNVGAVQVKRSIMLDNTVAGIEYTNVQSTWGKNGALIEDVLIVGQSGLRYADGIGICTRAGIKTPNSYYLTVSNVTLVNFNKSGCYALQACSHCPANGGGHETRFENTLLHNSPNVVPWNWKHEHVYRDITGNLTGTPGASLIPSSGILPSHQCRHHIESSNGAVNGSICDPGINFVLFQLKTVTRPSSLQSAILHITNDYGTSQGARALLPTKEIYQLKWNGGDRFVNISYDSTYTGMTIDDYLWIQHNFSSRIDSVNINNKQTSRFTLPPAGLSRLGDWYSDDNDTIITYYVNGSHPTCFQDVSVKFTTYQCHFDNCIIPPPPEPSTPEPIERSNITLLWSNASIWPNEQLPVEGSDVFIDCNDHVLVDVSFIPRLNILTICGSLEFVDDHDHFLQANRVLIDGGGILVAGKDDTPFQHQLTILLNGDVSSHQYRLPNGGPVLGAKALGVFGQLSLHGKERLLTWTVLERTATIGSTQIILRDKVDWIQGEEIVISSTYYEAGQTEERTIVAISSDGKTITINKPLDYNHLGGQHNTQCCKVNINAEVGLLSRNIKIIGTHPNGTNDTSAQQSYGCRVLVSTYFNSTKSSFVTGTARLSGVEFKGCGQEGFVDTFDPRYSLAFLSTGTVVDNSSYIKNCSFHRGYSIGIGIFGADNMIISNNVIHRTVGPSLYITGRNHVVKDNLAVVALFPGTYRKPNEPKNAEWTSNYELTGTTNLLLIGNSAAGGAKAGFHINGESCNGQYLWRDNIAHSTLHGIHVGYSDGQPGCSAFNRFTVYSCYHYGIFAFTQSSILIAHSTFVNNYAATFTSVIGPSALTHAVSNKNVIIRDTVIISTIHPSHGGPINCTEYNNKPTISLHPVSHSPAIQSPWKGHVGIILTSFTSSKGGFPTASWTKKKGYPAIAGLTKLTNVQFCNFGTHCRAMKEVALMTDPTSFDAQHPVWIENVSFLMGTNSSKFYNHNPSLGKINPADCVDMDCDGLKKILVRDMDGSFTGTNGLTSLISRSEYEWNGDRRRGLGDYRIPIAMLSRADGSRIDINSIYPNKGIYRGDTCQWMAKWNSYQCTNIDHMMLIIESLDADTEVRRLSPVGLGASGYIDLINGPQDQGWCGGYTCQERISTFYTIVSTGLNYTVGLTSTNPQRTNFILLNANSNQSLMIAYIYNNPQRLDVYVGSEYIIPTNGYMKDGNLHYRRGTNFIPSPSDSHGINYYDRREKKLYIVIRGDRAVRVETTPVIQLGIDLPPITVNDFFEANLVRNLALLLGITPNRIRVVNVISEGGTRKREITRTRVEIEIGDAPSNTTTPTSNTTMYNTTGPTAKDNETFNELMNITTKVGEVIQTGELSKSIGYKILDAQLIEPKPIVSDPTGGVRAMNDTGGPQPGDNGTSNLTTFSEKQFIMDQEERNSTNTIKLSIPTRLVLISLPTQIMEGVPLRNNNNTLQIGVHDESGAIVSTLGIGLPWQLTVSISSSTINGLFLMNDVTNISMGLATFSDLVFSHSGQYSLMFQVTYPSSANFTLITPVTVLPRSIYLTIITQPPLLGNTTFPLPSSIIVHVLDRSTGLIADNLGWRNRTWYMSASFITNGHVYGQSVNTTIQGGVANFSSLHITEPGLYKIRFTVFTSDGYQLPQHVDSNIIEIVKYQLTRLTIIFNNSFSRIVSGKEESFINQITQRLQVAYPDVLIYNVTVYEGSIIVSFFATSQNVNLLDNLIRGLFSSSVINQFTFNNVTLSLLSVKQDPNYPIILPSDSPTKEISDRQLIVIICASISGALFLTCIILTITIVCYNCWKRNCALKKGKSYVFKDDLYSSTTTATIYCNTPIFDENDYQYPTYHLKAVDDSESLDQQYSPIKFNNYTISDDEKFDDSSTSHNVRAHEKELHYQLAEQNVYTTFL